MAEKNEKKIITLENLQTFKELLEAKLDKKYKEMFGVKEICGDDEALRDFKATLEDICSYLSEEADPVAVDKFYRVSSMPLVHLLDALMSIDGENWRKLLESMQSDSGSLLYTHLNFNLSSDCEANLDSGSWEESSENPHLTFSLEPDPETGEISFAISFISGGSTYAYGNGPSVPESTSALEEALNKPYSGTISIRTEIITE